MDLGLDGCVAIVTGASVGIGRAVAETLGREGCRLVLVARSRDRLERAADGLAAALGARPLVVAEDITADGAAERVREATLAARGPTAILVNNAGGSRPLTGLGHPGGMGRGDAAELRRKARTRPRAPARHAGPRVRPDHQHHGQRRETSTVSAVYSYEAIPLHPKRLP